MQVFKLCLKVIQKNIPAMFIYIVVFMFIAVVMPSSTGQQKEISFTPAKTRIAFIAEERSPFISGLKKELEKNVVFVPLPDETEALQDALFFMSVSYILRVPEGFTDRFINGENVHLEKTIIPDSTSSIDIDLAVDKYFNTAKLYVQNMEGITQESLVRRLSSDLSAETYVEMETNGEKTVDHSYANNFFNYFAYSLFSIIILGMTALMLVFHNRGLKMRNSCSPISGNRINIQFLMANLLFTFISWLFMVLLCFVMDYKNLGNMNTAYFVINSFVFAICCSSISFLIGNLIKSKNAIPAVCNVVTLGTCFISGVFVPQAFLGDSVLKIASFFPTYWFVKANNTIATLTRFDFSHLKGVFSDMLIVACFALAFFAVALAIGKKRKFG